MQETMYEIEREAFLGGLYEAFLYGAGACDICASCPAKTGTGPNEYSNRECLSPRKARPAMEACGIDVCPTVRKADYEIDIVKEEGDYFEELRASVTKVAILF